MSHTAENTTPGKTYRTPIKTPDSQRHKDRAKQHANEVAKDMLFHLAETGNAHGVQFLLNKNFMPPEIVSQLFELKLNKDIFTIKNDLARIHIIILCAMGDLKVPDEFSKLQDAFILPLQELTLLYEQHNKTPGIKPEISLSNINLAIMAGLQLDKNPFDKQSKFFKWIYKKARSRRESFCTPTAQTAGHSYEDPDMLTLFQSQLAEIALSESETITTQRQQQVKHYNDALNQDIESGDALEALGVNACTASKATCEKQRNHLVLETRGQMTHDTPARTTALAQTLTPFEARPATGDTILMIAKRHGHTEVARVAITEAMKQDKAQAKSTSALELLLTQTNDHEQSALDLKDGEDSLLDMFARPAPSRTDGLASNAEIVEILFQAYENKGAKAYQAALLHKNAENTYTANAAMQERVKCKKLLMDTKLACKQVQFIFRQVLEYIAKGRGKSKWGLSQSVNNRNGNYDNKLANISDLIEAMQEDIINNQGQNILAVYDNWLAKTEHINKLDATTSFHGRMFGRSETLKKLQDEKVRNGIIKLSSTLTNNQNTQTSSAPITVEYSQETAGELLGEPIRTGTDPAAMTHTISDIKAFLEQNQRDGSRTTDARHIPISDKLNRLRRGVLQAVNDGSAELDASLRHVNNLSVAQKSFAAAFHKATELKLETDRVILQSALTTIICSPVIAKQTKSAPVTPQAPPRTSRRLIGDLQRVSNDEHTNIQPAPVTLSTVFRNLDKLSPTVRALLPEHMQSTFKAG